MPVGAPERHRPRTVDQALAPVKSDLDAVGQRLLSELADPVARNVVYLITAGGKRLRPALTLLCGACGPSSNRAALIDAATAVELIHTATLIHDDIIDQSMVRRAQPSFHAKWGTERAVLMGDYLYATSFSLLARLNHPAVMQVMATVCQQLCRGELREVDARFRLDLTEAEYFDIIRDKTASLVAGCCQSGAMLGGCDDDTVRRLTTFGMNFGMAFQIIDDCLDLTGDQGQLGKSILSDLDKGALSLPMIYLTQTMSVPARDQLFAPLREHATDPAFLADVAKAAESSGAIAKAHARAHSLVQAAREAVESLPIEGLQDAYDMLAEYAVSRRS